MTVSSTAQRLFPMGDLLATVRRFPHAVLCAVGLYVLSLLMLFRVLPEAEDTLWRLMVFLGLGYFWCGVCVLMAEAQGWSARKSAIIDGAGLGILAIFIILSPYWAAHGLFLLPAVLLLVMVAPYVRGGDDLSFWFFNRIVWYGVAVSIAAVFIITLGLLVALLAVEYLLGLPGVMDMLPGLIWLTAGIVIGPLYALYWVPKRFTFAPEDCTDPPGLKFFTHWIAVPMVFLYLGILYAYFIKILVTGAVPGGELAYLISGFAGAGIVTYLIAWPLRESGAPQIWLFYKIFFPALLIPAGFHLYAVYERIAAYGVTEERFALALSGVWLMGLAVWFTVRAPSIRVIPLLLAILLIGLGPWGASAISTYSQTGRLATLLYTYEMMEGGKIKRVSNPNAVPFEDRKRISSIMEYLCSSGRAPLIQKRVVLPVDKAASLYFPSPERCDASNLIEDVLGLNYVSDYETTPEQERWRVGEDNSSAKILDVKGYDNVIKNFNVWKSVNETLYVEHPLDIEPGKTLTFVWNKKHEIVITLNGQELITGSIAGFLRRVQSEQDPEIVFSFENEKIAARMNFSYIEGLTSESVPDVQSAKFDLLLRLK